MRHIGPLALGLCTLLAVSNADAAPKASNGFVLDVPSAARVNTPEQARALLVRQASIPAHVEFAAPRIVKAGPVTIYRFPQVSHGLRVISRGAAVAVRSGGEVALATARLEPRLPANASPSFDAVQAVSIAKTRSGMNTDPQKARLAVWPTLGGSRLVYVVRDASLFPSVPYVPVVVIDAETGRVVAQENAVRFKNLAKVHKFNPVSTPTLDEVTLPVKDPNVSPDNDDLRSFNCIDTKVLKPVSFGGYNINLHVCEMASMTSAPGSAMYPAEAFADPDAGDFLQYPPAADNAPGDPFGELAIFYHASQAYDYFRDLTGDPAWKLSTAKKAWPLYVIANVMMPSGLAAFDLAKMQDVNSPLEPLSNAMYTGWDPTGYGSMIAAIAPEIQGAALAFGQGSKIDFSYDGDVVFHEFGHAVVDSTAELGGYWHLDSQGASMSPGAMNEGIADFFSSAIAGDPNQGEYACKDLGPQANNCVGIRTLANDKTCPQWLTGEVHSDSEFFSAAMWEARAALTSDADKKAFDLALFTTLNTVSSGDLAYEELAQAFVKALEQSTLGKTGADAMTTAFTSRGILPVCHRLFSFEIGKPLNSKDVSTLAGLFFGASKADLGVGYQGDYAPGLMQIKVPIPAGTTAINASLNEVTGTSSNPMASGSFKPSFLVSWGKEIEFDPTMKANTDLVVPATSTKNTFGFAWAAKLTPPADATEAYVMIVNTGDASGTFRGINFKFESSGADAGPDVEAPDAEVDASEDSGAPEETPPAASDDSGCGCRSASNQHAGGLGAIFAALATILVARRKR